MASRIKMAVKQPEKFLEMVGEILEENLFRKDDSDGAVRSPEISYLAAVSDGERLLVVRDLLEKYEGEKTVFTLEIPFLEAIYVEFGDLNALFIAVRDEYNTLDVAKLNFGIDSYIISSLKKALLEKKLETVANYGLDTSIIILCSVEWSIAHKHRITTEDIYYHKMINTHELFIKQYRVCRDASDHLATCFGPHCEYQHIKTFSLFYYTMIRVMADVYQSLGDGPGFVVHDAGTSTSQLAMLLATLNADELMGLNVAEVIASDLEAWGFDCFRRCLARYENAKPVSFLQRDFLDETQELPEADVTILNDVLEHFPTEELAFKVFSRFWKCTRKLLIIHVPLEEYLSVEWGHQVLFSKEKLYQWANQLTGWVLLGEDYPFVTGLPYLNSGYLMLQKVDPVA